MYKHLGGHFWSRVTCAALLMALAVGSLFVPLQTRAQEPQWLPAPRVSRIPDWPKQSHCKSGKNVPAIRMLFNQLRKLAFPQAKLRFCAAADTAQAVPDGVVELGTSITRLPRCQAAFVIGHELAHLHMRHADEQLRIVVFIAHLPKMSAADALAALDFNMGLSFQLADVSQSFEEEADAIGERLAAQVGCEPQKAGDAWMKAQGTSAPTLLETHPSNKQRLAKLVSWDDVAHRMAIRAIAYQMGF